MKFIILLSCLFYITQIKASSPSDTSSESTESIPSHPKGHTSETSITTNTNVTENDFLNKVGGKISDIPDRVILHITTGLRTCNTTMIDKNRNVENDTESDHTEQIKSKKTGILKRDSSQIPSIASMKSFHKPIKKCDLSLLQNENNAVRYVLPDAISVSKHGPSQEQSVPQVSKSEELVKRRRYYEIVKLGMKMKPDEFLKQLCQVVKTFEQYKGFVWYLKCRNLVASFYVHGDMKVVKDVIIARSRIYEGYQCYFKHGDLETALPLALNEDNHDRFIGLLNARKEATAVNDEWCKQKGSETSFEKFVDDFLSHLCPWEGGMPLKRFLTLRGDALRGNYPDILDTLCEKLVFQLRCCENHRPMRKLLIDLIAQPSLLTPVTFVKGCLYYYADVYIANFIRHGWHEAVEEGLKKGRRYGGWRLWWEMRGEFPIQFPGMYPPSNEVLTAVLNHFQTKQQKEEEWAEKNAAILLNKIKNVESIFNLFPVVLWPIIANYAISWTDIDDSTALEK